MALLKVKTKDGWVEGIPGGNQAVSLFRGIPYAAPPVGDLRWRAPAPVKPWDGVLKAYKFTNICWQERVASEGGNDVIGNEFYCLDHPMSEDCLTLNVWTPAKRDDEKLPVGVYLHGGGYSTGYGFLNAYDGEGFGKRGVIFVTVTHRLNVFGFLSHPWLSAEDPHGTSGNYGILDLISALNWVKENISAFGGDPEKVTIFGQSGGGGKVQTLLASPLAKGLFRGAIMQSGGGLTSKGDIMSAGTLEDGERFGEGFFEMMGFKSLSDARACPAERLLNGLREYTRGRMMDSMGPKVDGYLLPEDPGEYFREGKHTVMPTMVGCTAEEFVNKNAKLPPREEIVKSAEKRFGEDANAYLKAIHIDDDPEKALDVYRYGGGLSMLAGACAWARNEAKLNRAPCYQYYFTLVPPGADRAHHSAEHHYVFQTMVRSYRPYTGRDWDLSNTLADYWANFIKSGDPNGGENPVWKPYTLDDPEALNIDYNPHMAAVPQSDYVRFMVRRALGEELN